MLNQLFCADSTTLNSLINEQTRINEYREIYYMKIESMEEMFSKKAKQSCTVVQPTNRVGTLGYDLV